MRFASTSAACCVDSAAVVELGSAAKPRYCWPDAVIQAGGFATATKTFQHEGKSYLLDMEWTLFPRVVLEAGLGDYESWTEIYWELRF